MCYYFNYRWWEGIGFHFFACQKKTSTWEKGEFFSFLAKHDLFYYSIFPLMLPISIYLTNCCAHWFYWVSSRIGSDRASVDKIGYVGEPLSNSKCSFFRVCVRLERFVLYSFTLYFRLPHFQFHFVVIHFIGCHYHSSFVLWKTVASK